MKRKNANNKSIFKYERNECPVCMEETSVESRSVTSPCMHEFCLECIGKWLTESSSSLCPLCKQTVKVIIYNIRSSSKYTKINFPKGFNNAWRLRNKIKNILDNIDSILSKIYEAIRIFFYTKTMDFDIRILNYLVYYGNLSYRIKSSSLNVNLTQFKSSDDVNIWNLVEKKVENRLLFLFSHNHSVKILKEINDKKCFTFSNILDILQKYIDPVRLKQLKLEMITYLTMANDPDAYLEYYIPGDHEHIIYTKDMLLDESTTSAVITKIITSINFDTPNMIVAGYQINHIDNIYNLLDYLISYDKILSYLSASAHYILLSDTLYTSNILKKPDIINVPITISTCDLIKHCFREEELALINQTLSKFEERLIYFEPLMVDDSNLSDVYVNESYENVFIELSDSDDDALEIISVNCPVYDLTESMTSDDDNSTLTLNEVSNESTIPFKKSKLEHESNEEINTILEHFQSSSHEPTTSSVVEITNSPIIIKIDDSKKNDSNQSECSFHQIDCSSDDDPDVDFIYQPQSVNDFYEYLMPKNLPNQ